MIQFRQILFHIACFKSFPVIFSFLPEIENDNFFKARIGWSANQNYLFWNHRIRLNVNYIRYQLNYGVQKIIPDNQENRQNSFIKSVFWSPQAHIKRTFTTVISRSIFKGRYNLAERSGLQPMGNGLPQNTFAPLWQPFTGYNKDMS